jgi:Holliday junction resolvase RusA-like endonuclease
MTDSVTIELPLPPRELSPNHTVGSRGGRLGKAAKIKKYRQLACYRTSPLILSNDGAPWERASVACRFCFARRGRRDRDNLLASMKAAFDGITDAGLVSDDAGLTHLPVEIDYDKANPRVVVTVTRQP